MKIRIIKEAKRKQRHNGQVRPPQELQSPEHLRGPEPPEIDWEEEDRFEGLYDALGGDDSPFDAWDPAAQVRFHAIIDGPDGQMHIISKDTREELMAELDELVLGEGESVRAIFTADIIQGKL